MSTTIFARKSKKLAHKMLSTTVAISLIASYVDHAVAQEANVANERQHSNSTTPSTNSQHPQTQPKQVTEAELQKYGIPRDEAEQATESYTEQIKEAERQGKVSPDEASRLLSLAENEQDQDGDQEALPVWVAAALTGCAVGIGTGEAKTQIKKALKEGGVDSATNIALGAAVDCVFGAVPGGAIGGFAKKWLAGPIRAALQPMVKKIVEMISKE